MMASTSWHPTVPTTPARSSCWKWLSWRSSTPSRRASTAGKADGCVHDIARRVRHLFGEENTGRTLVAVAALEQVGLITAADRGGAKFWELVPATGKKNLADAPILKCLEER